MMPEEWASIRSMARWVLPVLVGPRTAVTPTPRARGSRLMDGANVTGIAGVRNQVSGSGSDKRLDATSDVRCRMSGAECRVSRVLARRDAQYPIPDTPRPVPRCDGLEGALKFRNESRTNRARIADSTDFGLRSPDIWFARHRVTQDQVAGKPLGGFTRRRALTPRPITVPRTSQGRRGAIPEDNRGAHCVFAAVDRPTRTACS